MNFESNSPSTSISNPAELQYQTYELTVKNHSLVENNVQRQ